MREAAALDPVRRFVREHERGLVVAWLATLALVLGVGVVWGVRGRGFERAVDAWDARWPQRVEQGAQLVAAKRWDEAATVLEGAEAGFPARSVKHRLDRERERLLSLLAQCYVELGKKRRALETCAALVAFDPRNWKNHSVQANTAFAFGESELARQALDRLLAIHPTHLPSVEARIGLEVDAGAFAAVPPLWRAYQDAYRLATLEFSFAGCTAVLEVPADARVHRFELPFEIAERRRTPETVEVLAGEGSLATHGWSVDVLQIAFRAPRRIGAPGRPEFVAVAPGKWTVEGATELGEGRISAVSTRSSLRRALETTGSARAAFEVAVYKACTPSLWRLVETSYRNLLLWDELELERARTRVGGCLEAGSLFEE